MSIDSLSVVLRILDSENKLVERADQKAISLLSILGVFMVFFIAYFRVMPINILTAVLVSLYFFFALLSIIHLIMAIRPRIRKDLDEAKGKDNVLSCDPAFYTGICSFPNASAYKESLQNVLKDEALVSEIYIHEIYSVAKINAVKFKYVQRGVVLVITSLAIELSIIVYLFVYHISDGRIPSIF
jgi:hypothetical protein